MIKVSPHGLLNIQPFEKHELILALSSGEIEVFNWKQGKTVFKVDVAHTHQVQRGRVHPLNSGLLATVSFDGSLRVWDTRSMKLALHFEDRMAKGIDAVIQCLAWPPFVPKGWDLSAEELISQGTSLVMIGTSSGTLKLVDLKKNKVVWKEAIGSLIFDLDWNCNGVVAVATT